MARVTHQTPLWLGKNSPGHDLFWTYSDHDQKGISNANTQIGNAGVQCKRIVFREHQAFIAVGSKIRWADLRQLKELDDSLPRRDSCSIDIFRQSISGEGKTSRSPGKCKIGSPLRESHSVNSPTPLHYKILDPRIDGDIYHMVLSPSGNLMALLTTYSLYIMVVPDFHRISFDGLECIRPKTFRVTLDFRKDDHLKLRTLLWHPLGFKSSCLITISSDAILHIWEFDVYNRDSFTQAKSTINLPRLVDSPLTYDDMKASSSVEQYAFSPDSVDMDVASAAFGSTSPNEGHCWSSMTLWIAMKNGSVYALCPLLPSKWQFPSSAFESLRAFIKSTQYCEGETLSSNHIQELHSWFSQLEYQESLTGLPSSSRLTYTFTRPPSSDFPVQLQGPFIPEPDIDVTTDVTDIAIIPLTEPPSASETDIINISPDKKISPLSANVVLLLTSNGCLYTLLNVQGVIASFISTADTSDIDDAAEASENSNGENDQYDLVMINFNCLAYATNHFRISKFLPTFTPDRLSKYIFYITCETGVYAVSFRTCLKGLEKELNETSTSGLQERLEAWINTAEPDLRQILSPERGPSTVLHEERLNNFSICALTTDPSYGCILFAIIQDTVFAADLPFPDDLFAESDDNVNSLPTSNDASAITKHSKNIIPPRNIFQPSKNLWSESCLGDFLDCRLEAKYKNYSKEELTLSLVTLDVLSDVHRIISRETHNLKVGVADLFDQCEKLTEEFLFQLKSCRSLARYVDDITVRSDDISSQQTPSQMGNTCTHSGYSDDKSCKAQINLRIKRIIERQANFIQRRESLSRKLIFLNRCEPNEQERLFFADVNRWAQSFGLIEPNPSLKHAPDNSCISRITRLFHLKDLLKSQAKELTSSTNSCLSSPLLKSYHERDQSIDSDTPSPSSSSSTSWYSRRPHRSRQAKLAQIMGMLSRESALINATTARLERLRSQHA